MDVITTPILEMDLPLTLAPDEDVELIWYCENDPQTIYVEGFQSDDNNQLSQQGDNLPSAAREFILPLEWLWSDDNATSRSIQVGVVNHKVVNRIAVTFSDGAYKSYED